MKILVTGYHHSGTSILRKIIGNHKDIADIWLEVNKNQILYNKYPEKFVVMKAPNLNRFILAACRNLENLKVIAILRDPRDCFVSLNQRHSGHYSFAEIKQTWIECVKYCLDISTWPHGRLVRYEDLFKNNYEEIKKIIEFIGLDYYEEIITKNTERKAPICRGGVPDKEPPRTQQPFFRSYQINQPFKQHSGRYLKHLSKKKLDLFNDPEIKKYMLRLGYE